MSSFLSGWVFKLGFSESVEIVIDCACSTASGAKLTTGMEEFAAELWCSIDGCSGSGVDGKTLGNTGVGSGSMPSLVPFIFRPSFSAICTDVGVKGVCCC